ncbi:MAG: NAD(P)-binding domain-containing protein, partial [Bacteroidaceae bacterium]|nr:NAD(P)-binding domain-containing protein [Bacteroidaceae bacterium]
MNYNNSTSNSAATRLRVTVIGSGNMGGALVKGWHKAGQVDLTATAHTQATLDRLSVACPDIRVTTSNTEAVQQADVVVLAVKPWLVDSVLQEIAPVLTAQQTVVSVAANAKHERIDVYAMPNIAAEYGESMTFATHDSVKPLFDQVG